MKARKSVFFLIKCIVLFSFLLPVSKNVKSQIEISGKPYLLESNNSKFLENIPVFSILKPDFESLLTPKSESSFDNFLKKESIGMEIKIFNNDAEKFIFKQKTKNGEAWIINIKSDDAKHIGLTFEYESLPKNTKAYLYSSDKKNILGAFLLKEKTRDKLTIRPADGDNIFLEINFENNSTDNSEIRLESISYFFKDINKSINSRSDCFVSVNCSEGDEYQKVKKGVVRLITCLMGYYFNCSGSLVNTTSKEFKPYILTAAHCAFYDQNFMDFTYKDRWIVYFNKETECNSDVPLYSQKTLTGIEFVSGSGYVETSGSDFLLIRTVDTIPESYDVFLNGWTIENNLPQKGATIHHPDGDYKKISLFSQPAISSTFGPTENSHWKVYWSQTPNGHSVTEGGSSGAPLFNEDKLIVGTLTGGMSSCQNLNGEDYYGKFSYSWDLNGYFDNKQLKPWLDPENTGVSTLNGRFNTKKLKADFYADKQMILIDESINFFDATTGNPTKWQWYFDGAFPNYSEDKEPKNIKYPKSGTFDVKLIISDDFKKDTINMIDFIKVYHPIFPNPTKDGVISVVLNENSNYLIEIFDISGKKLQEYNIEKLLSTEIKQISLPKSSRILFVRISDSANAKVYKIFNLR